MVEDDFIQKEILAVNTANLASNMENTQLNRNILKASTSSNDKIIFLLEEILKEVKKNNDG